MSQWGALWALDSPARAITDGSNPQGNLAAPVGTMAIRSCDGAIYIKRGGGSTAFGWYLFGSDQYINWSPRFVATSAQMAPNASGQVLTAGANTVINFLPNLSTAGLSFSPKRGYVGGYTSGVVNNSVLFRPANNVDTMPCQRFDTAGTIVANFLEFDLWWDIVTTPRSNSGATSTVLANSRIWAGGVWGAGVVQASGGTVPSDTLQTEWPTALTVANGQFGAAFRFSAAALDWQFVTTACAAGAYGQTVTPMGVVVAANTAYRLRMRYVLVSGVLTAFASINDGTEIAVTTHMPAVGAGGVQPFQPLASVRTLDGVLKSLCAAQCAMNYGAGVGEC